jgi:hypothetical protein
MSELYPICPLLACSTQIVAGRSEMGRLPLRHSSLNGCAIELAALSPSLARSLARLADPSRYDRL